MWWLGETADERSLLNPVKTLKFSAILWHCSWAVESRAPSFKFSQGELRWLVTYRRGRHLTARGPPPRDAHSIPPDSSKLSTILHKISTKAGQGVLPSSQHYITPPLWPGQRRVMCLATPESQGWNPVSSAVPWVLYTRHTLVPYSTRPACRKFSKANTARSASFLSLTWSPNKWQQQEAGGIYISHDRAPVPSSPSSTAFYR